MPKKKTKILCTIPVPMPMNDFVDAARALSEAFKAQGRTTYIRNGTGCYEIFEMVEDDNGAEEERKPTV
jgi:hypothetical protein